MGRTVQPHGTLGGAADRPGTCLDSRRMSISIEQAQGRFAVEPGYLDSASIGAPCDETWDAMQAAMTAWRAGRAKPQEYDALVTASRASFARLAGVSADDVCVGSQASVLVGLVAAALPDGARVVAVEGDFTSALFPFMAQADRGVEVTLVPLADLAGAIDADTTLVTVSAVQSATGEIADLDAIERAAAACGAQTLVDATQACGWLPIDAARFDFVVCAAYKWLLCPRGAAFMTVRRERLAGVRPSAAGWYAGDDIWTSIYGSPLRLAPDARRLDVSPAWLCWVGAAPALALLEQVGIEAIRSHDVGLANRVREGLGMPPGDSAIVCVTGEHAAERLAAAGIRASMRAGAVRLSFHLYNDAADADRALAALAPPARAYRRSARSE